MRRPLFATIETLESRRLLNADWHNATLRCDVDDSGLVTPSDVLIVVNSLNAEGSRRLEGRSEGDPFLDVSGDSYASPIDALLIVNALNADTGQPSIVASVSPSDDPNSNGVVLKDQVTIEGTTRANAKVRIGNGDGERLSEALSDESGRFRVELNVDRGHNSFELSVQDEIGRVAQTTLEVRRGDLVTDWNAAILNVVREWTTVSDDPYEGRIVPSEPPRVARNMAMIHTAMFDAMNATSGEYESYLSIAPPRQEVVPEIAAAYAAYEVAASVYSDADSMAYWNATLVESLASHSNSDLHAESAAYGSQVGVAMLQMRNTDGSDETVPYSHGDAPGDWQRTFPGYLPPLLPQWDQVETFSGADVVDFRPLPPPALETEAYAEAVDEVYRLGGLSSDVRTEEQTEIAVFWVDGAGTFTPPGHWNQIAADVLSEREMSHLETARTFALLNLALADAGIAAWDAKYHYDLWRPIDAIRLADSDGNPSTLQDTSWQPLLVSPPFPTYTSGHSTFSGAADVILTNLIGHDVSFTTRNDAMNAPGQRPLDSDLVISRWFPSFHAAAEEAGISRVFGGVHFHFDNTAGLVAGREIGSYTANNILQRRVDA